MNKTVLLRACAAIGFAAIASCANAGAITSADSWSPSGADQVSVSATAQGLKMSYFKGNYFCAGCGDNYWEFKTTLDNDGHVSFDFDYVAFNGWYMAGSSLTFLVNEVEVAKYNTDNYKGSFAYDFKAGDILKLRAYETNGDSQPNVWGNIVLSNIETPQSGDVPEPATAALLGLGMLGLGLARRKG